MIRLQQIERKFRVGDQVVEALKNINLELFPGDYISVMGPSGSGKSTLLNIIALLDRATSGQYLLNGKEVTALDDDELARIRRQHIGFVFQFFHLIPRLSAAENIALPMLLAGIDAKQRRQRVDEALQAVGLVDRAGHRPEQLSGGQRQRVAIARATIMRPDVLLADEPTGNLDRASGMEIIQLLERLNEQGVTLIIITHDQELGNRAARQINIIDGMVDNAG